MPDAPILSDDKSSSTPSARTLRGGDPDTLGRIDHYDLLRRLGGGGFGVVYLALDTVSGVEVALKTLHPLIKRNAEAVEALRARFALVSRLAHPNIATALVLHPVRDANVWDESARQELKLSAGDSVMVMRYAPGTTLDRWRRQFEKGIAPLDKVVEIARQVAVALDYAHSEKVLHRDVSPRNIMVETLPDGALRARVLDFGLASEIRSSLSRVSGDRGGTSGTRPYMAPEVWRGRKQDHRTDQYSLACVLYEALTGAPPFGPVFETDDPAVIRAAVENDDPFAVENVPDCVNEAFARALAKNRHDRFRTCRAFVDALAGVPAANAPAARALQKPTVQGRAAAPAPAPAGTPPSAPSSTPSSSGTEDAELEASVLARRLALSREVKAVPSRVRADPELGAFAAQADSAMAVAEDAIKFGRFAAADLALSRAKDALISIAATQTARAKAAEDARRKAAEEAARRKAEEAEARRKAAEEAAAKKKAEEVARRKAAAEAAAKKKAQEEALRKAAEEAAAKRKAEEVARRKAAAEAAAKKRAQEEARREAAAKKKAEEEARRKAAALAAAEAAARKKAQEVARREREALEKNRLRAEKEAKARAEAEKRAAVAAARREARVEARHRRRVRLAALLPRIGRALAAVVAISVLGAGALWIARSRGGSEDAAPLPGIPSAAQPPSENPDRKPEIPEARNPGTQGEWEEPHAESAAGAEVESHAETAESAEVESRAESAERAEVESRAESAERAEVESRAETAEGTEVESHAESAESAEGESHAESAEGAESERSSPSSSLSPSSPVPTLSPEEPPAQSAMAIRNETPLPIDLGSGVSLEMVACPGVAPDFWMGKYEVTQEQWQRVMGTTPSSFKNKPKNPVETVSWNDCQEFVKKLNDLPAAKASGLTFRQPTEKEWETACRAGAPKSERYCKLADGTQITEASLSRVAWFGKNWGEGPTEVGKNREPNAWGLYDMHGNVWEWTQTADGVDRVYRGGCFDFSAVYCTAGIRFRFAPVFRDRCLGFRLAASGRTAAK